MQKMNAHAGVVLARTEIVHNEEKTEGTDLQIENAIGASRSFE